VSGYFLTPKAAEGIESIWDYIAEESGVRRADKVVDDIFRAIENLADMPGMGHGREDLADETLLAWPVHSYLVVYRDRRPLEVVHVVSGYRDLFELFANK
jgi:plasmid stabilization system protein ParE